MSNYVVSLDVRLQYAGLYLLHLASDEEVEFSLALLKDEEVLEPIFKWLFDNKYVEITADNRYKTSSKGGDVLANFLDRYRDVVENYDVYSGVDLGAGEFAFSYYDDFDDEDDWEEFLHQDRFEDLRVAVAEFKGIDPIEMIAMSFMNEGRFGIADDGWDYELLLGKVWDEITLICNSSLKVKNLSYSEGNKIISGESVVKDVYDQGQLLLKDLRS